MPLLGSGSTPTTGPYRDNICRGVNYLMARQAANGGLPEVTEGGGRVMYSHLIAGAAMSEALLVTNASSSCPTSDTTCTLDRNALSDAVQRAFDYAVAGAGTYPASGPYGGWKYIFGGDGGYGAPGPGGDLSHHLWGTKLYLNAKSAGLNVPAAELTRLGSFLDSVQRNPVTDPTYGTLGDYCYYVGSSGPYNSITKSMTVAGLTCRVILGANTNHPKIQSILPTMTPVPNATYYQFHATHLMFLVGGAPWDAWKPAIQSQLDAAQVSGGHADGSWYFGGSSMDGRDGSWNSIGGRHFCTVFALLCYENNFKRLYLGK